MSSDEAFIKELIEEEFEEKSQKESILALSLQIYRLNRDLQYLYDLIPMKYKKFNPSPGENPFFSINILDKPPDEKEYQAAKERMRTLLEKNGG